MKKSLILSLLVFAGKLALAHDIEYVIGEASCRPDIEELKLAAIQNAERNCNSKEVKQASDWEVSKIGCYGPGHIEWKGYSVQATFRCGWH